MGIFLNNKRCGYAVTGTELDTKNQIYSAMVVLRSVLSVTAEKINISSTKKGSAYTTASIIVLPSI